MTSPYTQARAKEALLRAHLTLHPESEHIRSLLAGGVSEHRVLALYPLDFADYTPTLKSAYLNSGAVKVALRLENTHKIMLQNSHAMGKRLIPGAEDSWDSIRSSRSLSPVLEAIAPLAEPGPGNAKAVQLRGAAYVMLLNMHRLLWHMEAWPGVKSSEGTISGAEERVLESGLRTLEAKYLNPMLTNIEQAIAARRTKA